MDSELIGFDSVLFLEPHEDDIALSATGLYFSATKGQNEMVRVKTIHPRGLNQSESWVNAIGGIGSYLKGPLHKSIPSIDWERRVKQGQYLHATPAVFSDEEVSSFENMLFIFLDEWFRGKKNPLVVAPLGLVHPDHILLADSLRSVQRKRGMKFSLISYEDNPYRWKPGVGTHIHNRISEMSRGKDNYEIVDFNLDGLLKSDLFRKSYTTEVGVLNSNSARHINKERYYIWR